MWYRFEPGSPLGIPRAKSYHVAFYDMTRGGTCFDETFFEPVDVDRVMPYVETIEDDGKDTRSRVFVHFDDGDTYEFKLVKVDSKRKRGRFYD